jgi:hypothetical protein
VRETPPAPARPEPVAETAPPDAAHLLAEAGEGDEAAPVPAGPLEAGWEEILRSLKRQKGRRFNLGALLRASTDRDLSDGVIVLVYSHPSHRERMEQELDDPQTRRLVENAFATVLGDSYKIQVSEAQDSNGRPRANPLQSSHLVRAAIVLGAQVSGEKEDTGE